MACISSNAPLRHTCVQSRWRCISTSERCQLKWIAFLLKTVISELWYRKTLGIFLQPFSLVLFKLDRCSQLRKICVCPMVSFPLTTLEDVWVKTSTHEFWGCIMQPKEISPHSILWPSLWLTSIKSNCDLIKISDLYSL